MSFMKPGKLSCSIFFLLLLFSPGQAGASVTVHKVTQLQFEIGRDTESLAKPVVSWADDLVLIDQKTLFFWKKKKLIQYILHDEGAAVPCSLVFAPDGKKFAARAGERALLIGSIESPQVRQVRDERGFDRLLWTSRSQSVYFTRHNALFHLILERNYPEKIMDGLFDFFLSNDDSRVTGRTSRGEDFLLCADGTCKSPLPPGCLLVERRGAAPFIKNMSPDFRRMIVEKKGEGPGSSQARGFFLYRIDWRNKLTDRRSILEDFRGGQDAAFSPDMTKIALSVKDAAGLSFMVILSAEGEILVKSSPQPGWMYQNPLWSPGSDWVVWNYLDMNRPENQRSRHLIADARGVALQLLPHELSTSEFYWSPRGDQIVVRVAERGFQEGHYSVYSLKERKMRELFKDTRSRATSRPCWSPDGKILAIIDYTNFQKREKRIEMVGGQQRERESVFFREQVFFYNPSDDTLLLAW